MGADITKTLAGNLNPGFDLVDIQQDIPFIQAHKSKPVNWRWYQEGYSLESTDTNGIVSHSSYVSHHNGAQYFGYIANTPQVSSHLRGLSEFFTDITRHRLPKGGVFYIRGGFANQMGLKPAITNPDTPADEVAAINAAKSGELRQATQRSNGCSGYQYHSGRPEGLGKMRNHYHLRRIGRFL